MATYRYIPMQYVTTAHNMGDHTPQPQQQHSTEHTQQQIQQQQQQVLPLHHLQQNLPPGVILTTNGGGGSSGGATTPSSSASGSFGGGRDGGLRNPPMGIWKKQLAERGCATCIHSKCCLSFLSMAGMVAHNKNCTGYAHEGDYVVCNVCGIKFKHYRSMQTHRVKSHYELNHSNSQPMPQGPFQGNPVAMQQQQQQQQPGARLNQAPKYEYPYALPPATTITPMHHNQQPMQIQQQQHQQQHPHYVQITTQPQESPTAGVGEVRYSFQGPSAPSGRNSKAPQQQLQYLPEQVVQNLQETPKPLDDEARALQNSRIMAESRLISTPRKRGRPAKNRGPVLMNHPHMPPPPPGYQYQTMPPICSSGINSSSYSSINVLSESSTSTSTTVPAGVMRLQPTPATMTQQQQQPNTGQIRLIPRTNSSSTPSLLVSSHSGATASVATPPAFPLSNHSSPSQTPGIRTGAASSSSVVAPTPPPSGSTTVNGVVIKRDLDLEAREKELADQEAKLLDYERLVLQSERLAEEARKVALDERERKMKQRQEELRKRLADAVQVLEDTKSIRIQQPSTSSSGGAVGSSDLDIPSRFSTPASSSAAEPTSTGQIMEGVDAYQESSTLDSSSIREDQLSTASENQILTPAQDVSSMTNINDDRPLDLPSSSPATIQASATPPRRKRVRILRPVIRHERGDQAPAGEPESILPDNPEEDQQPNPVRKQEEERQRSYSSSSNRDTDGAVSPPPAEDDSSQVISFVSPQTDNVSCDGVAQKSAESESTVKNCSGDENDGCKTAEKQKSSCDNDSTPNQTNDMDISVPKPEQKSRAKNPEADVPATPQPTVSSSSPEPQTPSTVDKRPIALGEITIEKISGPSSKPLTALKPLPNEEFGGRACRPLTTLTPQPLDTVINPLPPVAAPSLPPVSLIPVPKENEASEILKVLKPVDASTVPPSSCSGTDAGSTPPIVAKVLSLLPPKRAEPEPDNSSFTIIPPGFIKLEPQQQQLQQRVNVGPPLNSMEPVQNEVIIEYLDSDGKPTDAELVLDTWQASALEKSGQIVMDYVPTPSKAKSLPSHEALEPSTNIEHVEPEAEKTSELDSASASVDHVQVAVEPIKPSKPLLVQSEETASLMTDLTSGSRRDEDTSAVLEDSSLDQNPAVDCEGSSDTRDYPKPEEVTTSRHREAKLVPDPNDIEEQVTKHFEEDLATDNEVMDNSHDVSDGKSISDIINRLEDDDTGNESETKTDDASMPEKPCTEKERAPDKSDENDEVAVPPKKSSPAQPLKPYVLEVTKCSKLDDNAGEPKETSANDLADSTAAADSANDALTCQPKSTESSSAKQPETKNKSPSYTHTIGTREMEITPARKSTRILRKPTLLAKKDKPAEDEQPAKENVISSSSKKDNVDVPLRRARKRKQTPTPMLELQDEVPEPIVQAPTSKKRKKRGSGKSAPVAEPDLICGKCDSSLKNQKLFSVHIAKVHCGLARLKGESQEFSKEERDEAIKAAFTEVKSVTCYKCDEKVFTTRTGLNYHLTTCGLTKDEIQVIKQARHFVVYLGSTSNLCFFSFSLSLF